MMAVLGPPTFKNFVVIVSESDGELEVAEVIAGLDLTQERGMNFQVLCRAVKLLGNNSVEVEVFGHSLFPPVPRFDVLIQH
jgi:hypothetical protein